MAKNAYNPRTVRRTLENRDFLTGHQKEAKIREKNFFIYITGPKGSGKSVFTDLVYQELGTLGYPVVTSRASLDADKSYIIHRRELLEKQAKRDPKLKWYQVISALREEAVSAFQSQKVTDFLQGNGNPKKRILLLNRYPLVDTLAFQYLQGSRLEGVANYLRGTTNEESSGYVKPDLVLIFTCNGAEATKRILRRNQNARGEQTAEISGDLAGEIDKQIEALYQVSGYNPKEEKFTNSLKTYPGLTHIISTDTEIDYLKTPTDELTRLLEQIKRANARKVLEEIILPAIAKR